MTDDTFSSLENPNPERPLDETDFDIAGTFAVERKRQGLEYPFLTTESETSLVVSLDSSPPPSEVEIPPAPPTADIDKNISDAWNSTDPWWFYNNVKSKGPWDYKKDDPQYEDFGNFNFVATALAFGFNETFALVGAGVYHIYSKQPKKKDPEEDPQSILDYGEAFQGPPYGDDPKDQEMIRKGMEYFKTVYLKKYPTKESYELSHRSVMFEPDPWEN